MKALVDEVRSEVVELHDFFTAWFNGSADKEQLESRFISRLHPTMVLISPEGNVLHPKHLKISFEQAYGSNPNFRIQIRDVEVQHDLGSHVLATYTEWQTGAQNSDDANNARFTTVLMTKGEPMMWLHVQETWLPESARAAGSFDF